MPRKTPQVSQRNGGQARFEASKRGKSGAQPSERQLARWKVDAAMREIYERELDRRESHRQQVKEIAEKHGAKSACVARRLREHARMMKDQRLGAQEDLLTGLEKEVVVRSLQILEHCTWECCDKKLVVEILESLFSRRKEPLPDLSDLWWRTWRAEDPRLDRIVTRSGAPRRGLIFTKSCLLDLLDHVSCAQRLPPCIPFPCGQSWPLECPLSNAAAMADGS